MRYTPKKRKQNCRLEKRGQATFSWGKSSLSPFFYDLIYSSTAIAAATPVPTAVAI